MSHQLEIKFSYGAQPSDEDSVARMRRLVDWPTQLNDLFADMSAEDKHEVGIRSGASNGSTDTPYRINKLNL